MTAQRVYKARQLNRITVVKMDYVENYHRVVYSIERKCRHLNIQGLWAFDDPNKLVFKCMECGEAMR